MNIRLSEAPKPVPVNMPEVDSNSNNAYMQTGGDHWKSTFLDTRSSTATARTRMTTSSEDWKHITDSSQRKKVQNRIAQRTYREPTTLKMAA